MWKFVIIFNLHLFAFSLNSITFSLNNFKNDLCSISYQLLDAKWIFTKLYNGHFAISLEEYEDNIAVIMTTSDELYNFLDFLKTTYKKIISEATL